MRVRLALTLALGAAVLGLGALVLRTPAPTPTAASMRVIERDAASVRRLRLEPRAGAATVLERRAGGWYLAAPPGLPANPLRVQGLLAMTAARSFKGFAAAGNDLAQFGLDPPAAVLWLDEDAVYFGDTEPLDGQRYVMHDGQVHLLDDHWFGHLAARPENFVHPAPLGPDPRLQRLRLADQTLALEDGRWRLVPPAPGISADRVTALLDGWRHARAAMVTPLDPARAWQSGAIEVTLAGELLPRTFALARTGYEVLLGDIRHGVEYHLPRRVGERLLTLQDPAAPR